MEKLIDCHCHLDLYRDPQAVAREAASRGVYVISVTTTPTAYEKTARLAPPGSRIRTALGLHPELAVTRKRELALFEDLLPSVRYVGEVGLDGSLPHKSSLDEQAAILMHILILCARHGGKVVSLHSRGARGRLLDLVGLEPRAGRMILHWFTGSRREVARAVELGCWFSVGPAMMASRSGRAAVEAMPRDRVVPETDGPFGTTTEGVAFPWDAMGVGFSLAEIWRESVEVARETLFENFKQLVRTP